MLKYKTWRCLKKESIVIQKYQDESCRGGRFWSSSNWPNPQDLWRNSRNAKSSLSLRRGDKKQGTVSISHSYLSSAAQDESGAARLHLCQRIARKDSRYPRCSSYNLGKSGKLRSLSFCGQHFNESQKSKKVPVLTGNQKTKIKIKAQKSCGQEAAKVRKSALSAKVELLGPLEQSSKTHAESSKAPRTFDLCWVGVRYRICSWQQKWRTQRSKKDASCL